MVDEIYDRSYQAGRAQLNDGVERGLAKLGGGLAATFRALHDVQFAAPWGRRRKDTGCA